MTDPERASGSAQVVAINQLKAAVGRERAISNGAGDGDSDGRDCDTDSYTVGVVAVIWPFSYRDQIFSILLADADVRVRRNQGGQIRVRFAGKVGLAVSQARIRIGDRLRLALVGAVWEKQESEDVLSFVDSVDVCVIRDEKEDVNIKLGYEDQVVWPAPTAVKRRRPDTGPEPSRPSPLGPGLAKRLRSSISASALAAAAKEHPADQTVFGVDLDADLSLETSVDDDNDDQMNGGTGSTVSTPWRQKKAWRVVLRSPSPGPDERAGVETTGDDKPTSAVMADQLTLGPILPVSVVVVASGDGAGADADASSEASAGADDLAGAGADVEADDPAVLRPACGNVVRVTSGQPDDLNDCDQPAKVEPGGDEGRESAQSGSPADLVDPTPLADDAGQAGEKSGQCGEFRDDRNGHNRLGRNEQNQDIRRGRRDRENDGSPDRQTSLRRHSRVERHEGSETAPASPTPAPALAAVGTSRGPGPDVGKLSSDAVGGAGEPRAGSRDGGDINPDGADEDGPGDGSSVPGHRSLDCHTVSLDPKLSSGRTELSDPPEYVDSTYLLPVAASSATDVPLSSDCAGKILLPSLLVPILGAAEQNNNRAETQQGDDISTASPATEEPDQAAADTSVDDADSDPSRGRRSPTGEPARPQPTVTVHVDVPSPTPTAASPDLISATNMPAGRFSLSDLPPTPKLGPITSTPLPFPSPMPVLSATDPSDYGTATSVTSETDPAAELIGSIETSSPS